jgi:hypothetical protein
MIRSKYALAGCGGVVKRYRRTYAQLPRVQVIACIDANEDEARSAAAELGAGTASSQFADALADEVDAVVISTPNHLHAEHAIAAFAAGKHVLLQKPMARSAAECDRILAAPGPGGAQTRRLHESAGPPVVSGHSRDGRSRLPGQGGFIQRAVGSPGRSGVGWPRGELEGVAGARRRRIVHSVSGALPAPDALAARPAGEPCAVHGDQLCLPPSGRRRPDAGAIPFIRRRSGRDRKPPGVVFEEHVLFLAPEVRYHYRENAIVEFTGQTGPFDGEYLHLRGDGSLERFESCLAPAWDDAANPYNQHRRFCEALLAGEDPEVSGEEAREDVRLVEACYAGMQGELR